MLESQKISQWESPMVRNRHPEITAKSFALNWMDSTENKTPANGAKVRRLCIFFFFSFFFLHSSIKCLRA